MKKTPASNRETEPRRIGRRRLIQALGAGGAGVVVSRWSRPVVDSVLVPLHAQASPTVPMGALYAVSGAGNATSVLYMLDPATGAVVSTIGSTGYSHVTGLAFHPFTGVLYGVTSGGEEFSTLSQLLILDPFTGAGTPVGPTGFTSGVPDISFSPGGVLYAWYENGDDLATIDLTTGAGTVLGDAGISTARTGLAFNSAGRLWTKDDDLLYEISPADGTPIGSVTISVSGLHNALVFNQFDVMYGLRRTSGMELYTIDPTSGAASLVGSNALTNIAALAFGPVLT